MTKSSQENNCTNICIYMYLSGDLCVKGKYIHNSGLKVCCGIITLKR